MEQEGELPDPAGMVARLFPRGRVRLVVEADLDPVPGWGDCPEDWRLMVERMLIDAAGHYHPTVVIEHIEPEATS